jgi:predicted DNA-binding transcriptional regulator AlpA
MIQPSGVSRQRVYELTSREDFPPPLAVLGMGKVWKYDDVAAWARSRGRQIS